MASVDSFVKGAPPVSPAQAAGWTKYRLKTSEAVAPDRYREGHQRAAHDDRYREGMGPILENRTRPGESGGDAGVARRSRGRLLEMER